MRNSLVIGVWSLIIIWSLGFLPAGRHGGIWSFPDEVGAMGGPVPKGQPVGLLIDDFEDGNFIASPAWWVFDQVSPEVISPLELKEGDAMVLREIGKSSLNVSGRTKIEWYAGGMGVYLARPGQDLSAYRNFQVDVYGYGPGQGTLKIELFDDDNNNWDLEQNTKEAYAPLYDDRFAVETVADWVGWRRLVIPFIDFRDTNPGVGDDLWNPAQTGQSGGFLQLQFIAISSRKIGTLQYVVDNVRLTK